MKRTVRITVGRCQMFVQGTDMPCPLCHETVRSGEHHECVIQRDVVAKKHGYGTKRTSKKGGKG